MNLMTFSRALPSAFAVLAAVALKTSSPPPPPIEPVEPTALERRMVELVNIERVARALPPFALSLDLTEAARQYSRIMAARGRVSHDFDGSVEDRIRSAEPETCRFGENVSKHTSVDYSIGDLMLSEGHRSNLLNEEFTRIGIGIAEGEDGFLYITQEFATPCDTPARKPESRRF